MDIQHVLFLTALVIAFVALLVNLTLLRNRPVAATITNCVVATFVWGLVIASSGTTQPSSYPLAQTLSYFWITMIILVYPVTDCYGLLLSRIKLAEAKHDIGIKET